LAIRKSQGLTVLELLITVMLLSLLLVIGFPYFNKFTRSSYAVINSEQKYKEIDFAFYKLELLSKEYPEFVSIIKAGDFDKLILANKNEEILEISVSNQKIYYKKKRKTYLTFSADIIKKFQVIKKDYCLELSLIDSWDRTYNHVIPLNL
jgi:competence protein ComGC